MLYQVMQGPDPLDPRTRGITPSDPMPMLRRGIKGLRLGRMPEAERAGVDSEVLAAYDAALELLEQLGAEIVTSSPCRFSDHTELTGRITGAEGYFLIDDVSLPLDEAVRPRIGLRQKHMRTTRQAESVDVAERRPVGAATHFCDPCLHHENDAPCR